jgi:prepilin-type N-terminal cleavage/methylation domain-containing protein/prepilin-type processing-associated H-X9-DG protein
MTRVRIRDGFTVVELLVVVAVMALLLALLVPALGSVRAAGRNAACMSNLRQMSIAAQRYALEYKHFPPAIRYENDGVFMNVAWDWITTFDDRVISPGPLWAFTDDPGRVQQCPEYGGGTNTADPFTGYNYNTTYVGGETLPLVTGWDVFRRGVRYSACRRTVRVALFGDGGWVGGTNKYMRAPVNTLEGDLSLGTIYSGGQAFRHRKATNVAYLDFHVDSVLAPFKGSLATDALLETKMDYPQNGFLSNDDTAYDPNPD